jgi:tight adherence protein B
VIFLGALLAAILVALVVAWLQGMSIFKPKVAQPEDEVTTVVRRIERAPSSRDFATPIVALAILAFLLVGTVVAVTTRSPILAIPLGLLAGAIPLMLDIRTRNKQETLRTSSWPDAIRQLTSNLRAPMSVHASLIDLAETGPIPLRPSFQTYAVLSRRLDSQQALEMVRRDLADPVSDRVIEVLILSLEQGAAVTIDVLTELANTVTQDLRLNATLQTMSLDVKIDAAAIGIIPFTLLFFSVLALEEWRDFYATPPGQVLILICMTWTAIGVFTILYLVRIQREPRILAVEATDQ